MIVLVGFMGAGKTTVGGLLAGSLAVPFTDSDHVIEDRAGKPIRQIFADDGEPAFRQLEAELLRETFSLPDVVVSTGGGTMVTEANARWIGANGLAVWLNPSFSTIVARIGALGKTDRPLFRDEVQALSLFQQRLPAYRRADVTVDVAPVEAPEEIAARIALLIKDR